MNDVKKHINYMATSWCIHDALMNDAWTLSQIRYLLVVILGLNSVSGVQYKDMMIDR